ncbi:hypothetical protein C0993_008169 [Termitomyces sp. T159_Od127]|nr:hypothetical protein C0993_008169 [Termitomyces sp. T159_Od127]
MSLTPLPDTPPLAVEANSSCAQLRSLPKSVYTLPQTAQLEALYTIIRDKNTVRFTRALDSKARFVACQFFAQARQDILLRFPRHLMSILQAMEAGLREVCRSVRIGKILIQRVRRSSTPNLILDCIAGRGDRIAEAILFQGKLYDMMF